MYSIDLEAAGDVQIGGGRGGRVYVDEVAGAIWFLLLGVGGDGVEEGVDLRVGIRDNL